MDPIATPIPVRLPWIIVMTLAASLSWARADVRSDTLPDGDPLWATARATNDPTWQLVPISGASIDEISRAVWWRGTVGLVVGADRSMMQEDALGAGTVHAGGAWRAPLDHGLGITMRADVLGESVQPTAWRVGTLGSLDLSPNLSLEAGAWWTAATMDANDRAADQAAEPSGAAWFGLSLRF